MSEQPELSAEDAFTAALIATSQALGAYVRASGECQMTTTNLLLTLSTLDRAVATPDQFDDAAESLEMLTAALQLQTDAASRLTRTYREAILQVASQDPAWAALLAGAIRPRPTSQN